MTVNRRKKNSRQRGRKFHGWGRGKAHHKGAGNRGGVGGAGSGKRAGQKKPSHWIHGRHYGKYGFKSKAVKKINPVNLEYIDDLVKKGLIKDRVDLKELGFNKLLGKGKLSKKLKIIVESASEKAIEKVKEVGGEVVLSEINNVPKEKISSAESDDSEQKED